MNQQEAEDDARMRRKMLREAEREKRRRGLSVNQNRFGVIEEEHYEK
jgi:hypothetical protein